MKKLQVSAIGTKLIIALLGVAFIPLTMVAYSNYRLTQTALIDNTNQTLLKAASQTAFGIDAFMTNNLDSLRVESQLPDIIQYLNDSPEERKKLHPEVEAILLTLSRKDPLYINSYALLDLQGNIILDTYSPDIGKNNSDHDYFQRPIQTGLPYVSAIYYSKAQYIPNLYFSSPIRNKNRQIIGILRVRYHAKVLQRLVGKSNSAVNQSKGFTMLIDENYIRLVQSQSSEISLQPIIPLPASQWQQLKSRKLIDSTIDQSLHLFDLKRGLDNAAKSPFFDLSLDNYHPDYQAAVVKLKNKPWSLVMVQSKSESLQPIQAQIRQVLWLSAPIAIFVIITAILIGRFLTHPILSLTTTVAEFTEGNLEARTHIQSGDEIGILALNFNLLAEQMSKLLKRLEERTRELEESQFVTVTVGELSRSIRNPQQLLKDAIALIQSRFQLQNIKIYLVSLNQEFLCLQADSSYLNSPLPLFQRELNIKSNLSLVAQAAKSQTVIWNRKLSHEPEWEKPPFAIAQVAVPLLSRDHLLGVMDIQAQIGDRFSQSDIETFKTLAGQIATALENAQLLEKIKKAEAQYREKAQELAHTLDELQKTQTQLIQTEKMSSLGQLVAGIAHEINNPINFIYGNISPASDYLEDLLELIRLYQFHYPQPQPQIQDYLEKSEIDFISKDFEKILNSIQIGAERIRHIVLSLRNFSRLDEAEMKPVDIHEGIENTLIILQYQLKDKPSHPEIIVVKDYGKLPKIECYAGQLNQVFMNLLTNAIDSIEERNRQLTPEQMLENPSQIWIKTSLLTNQTIEIRIKDNGLGMNQEVQRRLFDPFFTTKTVGKGTGLGLAISYQIIVDKHLGTLKCTSEPGQGAEFIIEIPLRLTHSKLTESYPSSAMT